MKHQLIADPFFPGTDHKVLADEKGLIKFCPYQQPIMAPVPRQSKTISLQGQETIQMMPVHKGCGTWCALFCIYESNAIVGCAEDNRLIQLNDTADSTPEK